MQQVAVRVDVVAEVRREVLAQRVPEQFAADQRARQRVHEAVPVAVGVYRHQPPDLPPDRRQRLAQVGGATGPVAAVAGDVDVSDVEGERARRQRRAVEGRRLAEVA